MLVLHFWKRWIDIHWKIIEKLSRICFCRTLIEFYRKNSLRNKNKVFSDFSGFCRKKNRLNFHHYIFYSSSFIIIYTLTVISYFYWLTLIIFITFKTGNWMFRNSWPKVYSTIFLLVLDLKVLSPWMREILKKR